MVYKIKDDQKHRRKKYVALFIEVICENIFFIDIAKVNIIFVIRMLLREKLLINLSFYGE
jgi:hypothetical protein